MQLRNRLELPDRGAPPLPSTTRQTASTFGPIEPPENACPRSRAGVARLTSAQLLAATENSKVTLMHCLPAFHDAATTVGIRA